MAGLLDFLGSMGSTPPAYMEGLLGQDQMNKLKGQATSTGLANMVLGYLAAPKNQNLGLGRILAGAAQAGMQGAQGVYSGALSDYETQQKIEAAQKAQNKQAQLENMINSITDPNEKLYAQIAPEQWVTGKFKTKEKKYEKVGDQLVDVSGETPTSVFTATPVAPFKVGATRDFIRGNQRITEEYQPNGTWKPIASGEAYGQGVTVNYGAPVSGIDASGNPVFFQPAKGGGAPSIVQGVTPEPKPIAAPTESQAKSATYYGQMTSATDELNKLYSEGFDPTKYGSQAEVSVAGTKASGLVSPEAQRARQAQDQWAESFLRIKTGAAATKDEIDRNVKTFFPTVGDKPANIAQKARARLKAEQDVLKMTKPVAPLRQNIMPSNEPMPARNRQDILNQYGVK